MKKNQKGFSIVEVLLIVVVIGVLGGIGWYVYSSRKKDTSTPPSTQSSSADTPAPAEQPVDPYAGWNTYNLASQKVSFKYPGDWAQEAPVPNGIVFKSPDFASQNNNKKISSGSLLNVYVIPYDPVPKEADKKKELLIAANLASMSTAANIEYLTVDGSEAIYFTHSTGQNLNSQEVIIFIVGNQQYIVEQSYARAAQSPYPGLVKKVAANFTKN